MSEENPGEKIKNECLERCRALCLKTQKHEEIKRMAWEIYQKMQLLKDKMEKDERDGYRDTFGISKIIDIAWIRAEQFYNYAKEKEGADEETDKA